MGTGEFELHKLVPRYYGDDNNVDTVYGQINNVPWRDCSLISCSFGWSPLCAESANNCLTKRKNE